MEQHYKENYENLIRRVQSKGLPKFLAEEVVQETYTKALEAEWKGDDWFNKILSREVGRKHSEERRRGMVHVPKDLFEEIKEIFNKRNSR